MRVYSLESECFDCSTLSLVGDVEFVVNILDTILFVLSRRRCLQSRSFGIGSQSERLNHWLLIAAKMRAC